jgi:tetratricopeptide (TPR) repeat protein
VCAVSLAQTGTVTVLVTDQADELPVAQAEVKISTLTKKPFTLRGFTDAGGHLTFTAIRPGGYNLEVAKDGYETGGLKIAVTLRSNKTHSVRLRRSAVAETKPGPAPTESPTARFDAQVEYERALLSLSSDTNKSIDHFRRAVELHPKFAMAYTMLGLTHMRRNESYPAFIALAQAVEADPNLAVAHMLFGKFHLEAGKYARAEQLLLKSIKLDPKAWESPYELSRCYFGMGKYDQALQYARLAQTLPKCPTVVHMLLSDIYFKMNDKEKALGELKTFVQTDPTSRFAPRVKEVIEKLSKELGK